MIEDSDGNAIRTTYSKNNLVFGELDNVSHFSVNNVISSGVVDSESMIWTITTPSDNFTFRIQGQSGASYNNYDVDWGDGSSESGITTPNKEHIYTTSGLYEIKVKGNIYIRNQTSTWTNTYTEWKQWGTATNCTGFREWFQNCINMSYSATDVPTFALVGSASYKGTYRSFFNCDSITSLDLSGWDVSSLSNIGAGCFQSMNNIETINISNWDLSGITTWSNSLSSVGNSTPEGCILIAPNVNFSATTTLSQCLYQSAFKSINVSNWTLRASGVNINQMFRGIGSIGTIYQGICTLDISTWNNTSAISSANGSLLFFQAKGLTDINITNFNFTGVTDFSSIFKDCTKLENIQGIESQRWDSATTLASSFQNTYKLKFDTYNIANDLGSAWSVTNFSNCFFRCGFSNALGSRSVFPNIVNWKTSNATSVAEMFRESRWNGTSVFKPSSSWDLSNINSFRLFAYAHVGIQTWDWSNVTISSVGTTMRQFATYVSNGSTPRALTTMIFGANCDFSGVETWSNFVQLRNGLTRLQFDTSVSFASTINMSNFGNSVPLETTYYDQLLVRLDATNTKNSVVLTLNLAKFTLGGSAEASRTQLITGQSWTITDAGGI